MLYRVVHVLELTSFWVPRLRQEFQEEAVFVHRQAFPFSHREFQPEFAAEFSGLQSVIVLDLANHPQQGLEFLRREREHLEAEVLIGIGSVEIAELEWSFRELGLTTFVFQSVSPRQLASCCRKGWKYQQKETSKENSPSCGNFITQSINPFLENPFI